MENISHPATYDKSSLKARTSERTTGPDGKGSSYCPYNEKSLNYNSTRRPLGVGFILGSICMTGVPLSKVRLLDIGCGTGSFIAEVWPKLEHVTGLEISDGMLTQARATLKDALAARRVDLVQAEAINLPFDTNVFHAVTLNVVIHHFPKEDNFAYLKQVFNKVFKVLKFGGCLVITHSLPEQNRDGLWFAPLLPKAIEHINERSASFELIVRYLKDVGFSVDEGEIMTPLRGTYQSPYLEKYGINGAFVQEYRDGDSSWAIAESTGELGTCLAEIRRMKKNGTVERYLSKRETLRKLRGQATLFVARKLGQLDGILKSKI